MKNATKYAFTNPQLGYKLFRQNAREMEEDVMYQYINLNVNDHTLEPGEEGRQAISVLDKNALEIGVIKTVTKDLFVKPK